MNNTSKAYQLDLRVLGESLYYNWRVLVVPVIVIPLVIALLSVTGLIPKKYSATTKVLVQENVSVNPFMEDLQVPWTVQQRLPVIQAILVSRQTLETVLVELKEISEETSAAQLDEQIAQIRKQIQVQGMGGGLIEIAFVGKDPARIYKSLQLLVDILVDAMLRPQKQSLEDANSFLEEQIKSVRTDLIALEMQVQEFKQQNVEELPEVFRANLDSYMSNQSSLLDAETQLRAARMRRRNLEQRLRIYNPIARDLESNLIGARTRLSELRAVFTEDHPEIIALKEHIKQLSSERKAANLKFKSGKLDLRALEGSARMETGVSSGSSDSPSVENRTNDIVTSDLLEYRALSAEIASLQGAVGSLKNHGKETLESIKSFAETERTLQELMREHEVKQSTYTLLLKKSEDAKVTKALSMYDEEKQIVLIETPRVPTAPTGITLPLLLGLGVFIGLVLGFSIIIVRELLGKKIRSVQELQAVTGLAPIGILPKMYDVPASGNPSPKT